MALDHEILTVKEVGEVLRVKPVHGLQVGQAGQDSSLQDRVGLAISNGRDSALAG